MYSNNQNNSYGLNNCYVDLSRRKKIPSCPVKKEYSSVLTGQMGILFRLDRSTRNFLPSWPVKTEFSSVLTGQHGMAWFCLDRSRRNAYSDHSVLTGQNGRVFRLDRSRRRKSPSWPVKTEENSDVTGQEEFSSVLTGQNCYGAKRNVYSDY